VKAQSDDIKDPDDGATVYQEKLGRLLGKKGASENLSASIKNAPESKSRVCTY
jgi:hypothetical protein